LKPERLDVVAPLQGKELVVAGNAFQVGDAWFAELERPDAARQLFDE